MKNKIRALIEEDFIDKYECLAGCDEVGRGSLAGPVVGACVLLNIHGGPQKASEFLISLLHKGVKDSKKLSPKKRQQLIQSLGCHNLRVETNPLFTLEKNEFFSLKTAIVEVSHRAIDEINILRASLLGMGRSFSRLKCEKSTAIFIDGTMPFEKKWHNVCQMPLVQGESKSILIALSSIFAKEYRDSLMKDHANSYPHYGLENHVGYPTKKHREAIAKYGITAIHRKSFKGVKEFCQP